MYQHETDDERGHAACSHCPVSTPACDKHSVQTGNANAVTQTATDGQRWGVLSMSKHDVAQTPCQPVSLELNPLWIAAMLRAADESIRATITDPIHVGGRTLHRALEMRGGATVMTI